MRYSEGVVQSNDLDNNFWENRFGSEERGRFYEKLGAGPYLDEFGQINMDAFTGRDGFSKEEIESDAKWVIERQLEFSGLNKDVVLKFYKKKYRKKTIEECLERWREAQRREKHARAEQITVEVFQKILGDKFLVVKASDYDDYKNGVDTLVIDAETGHVFCAIDEVHEEGFKNRNNQTKTEEKITKVHNKMKSGGCEVKYGFEIVGGKLKPKKLKNLPIFYISVTTQTLNTLTSGKPDLVNEEIEFMTGVLSSFDSQRKTYENIDSITNEVLIDNLSNAKVMLDKMRKKIEEYKKNNE